MKLLEIIIISVRNVLSGFLTLSDFETHKQEDHSEEVLFTCPLRDEKYSIETKSEPHIDLTPSKVSVHHRYGLRWSLRCLNDPSSSS